MVLRYYISDGICEGYGAPAVKDIKPQTKIIIKKV